MLPLRCIVCSRILLCKTKLRPENHDNLRSNLTPRTYLQKLSLVSGPHDHKQRKVIGSIILQLSLLPPISCAGYLRDMQAAIGHCPTFFFYFNALTFWFPVRWHKFFLLYWQDCANYIRLEVLTATQCSKVLSGDQVESHYANCSSGELHFPKNFLWLLRWIPDI